MDKAYEKIMGIRKKKKKLFGKMRAERCSTFLVIKDMQSKITRTSLIQRGVKLVIVVVGKAVVKPVLILYC